MSEQASRTGVLAVTVPRREPGDDRAGRTARRVRRAGRRRCRAGQRCPLRPAAGTGDVAAGGHAVGSAAAAEHQDPGRHDRRPARARLRHRRRRVRLRGRRPTARLRDHRRNGPRHRLDAADRARRRRLPARAPQRRLDPGHPHGHRPGAHRLLRRRLVRHRHRRQARLRHRPAGMVVRRASAAAAAARPQGRRGADQRAGPAVRPARQARS